MATKFCYKCKTEKDVSEFNRDTTKKDGCSSFCKECQKQYRKDNRIKISKRQKKYFKNNKAKNREYSKRDYKKNREKKLIYQKQYSKNNKKTISLYHKQYRIDNKATIKVLSKQYGSLSETKMRKRKRYKEKEACDPMYRLNHSISGGIRMSLKGNKKGRHWENIVGYTLDKLKKHLEKQFTKGMSWANYGKGGWVIDHVTPRTVFNFTEPSHKDFKKCWALKNLQPLWEYDNSVKGSKLKHHFQPSLLI